MPLVQTYVSYLRRERFFPRVRPSSEDAAAVTYRVPTVPMPVSVPPLFNVVKLDD